MDSDKPSSTGRKHRFNPKPRSRGKTKAATASKTEMADDNDDSEVQRQQVLQHFNELGKHRRSKVVDKVQATFIHGGEQTVSIRGSDCPQDVGLEHNRESDLMDLDDSTEPSKDSSISAAGPSLANKSSEDDSKEYGKPRRTDTYHPTILPWRRPNSGDPDILDEAEFGEAATKYDENAINPASELGLLNPDDTSEKIRLLLLKLPKSLPSIKRSATAEGEQIQQGYSLKDLPPGHMGKMCVYKSGAVKLKLGETQFDVSPGTTISDAEEVVAVNAEKKEFLSLGDLDKRMIITPDVDDILDNEDLG
ncbi:uncharacterized protein LOC104906636 isoform X2 [Beta vulgaris subsp. vulgaris]|uniref:uncharacterized protein LOC104906636 isoform X2 n=1 Tax=Beta vulgaris subsp. vulgaris TaxID=3555 RepID=UPI00090072E5|nr:uncharacterized protein LOC104906636 isoform X2 [Beta vulgaris subsp. vulgaris]